MEERVQKILARAGYGSRRACESLIVDGKVKVNGKTAILGMKADPEKDKIEVNHQTVQYEEEKKYIILNKPRGVLSVTNSHDNRKCVRDLVDEPGSLYPVGRLDVDSEGLILLTNDGELTNRLTHPRYDHEKEYSVLVAVRPDEQQLDLWRRGIVLEDGYRTRPAKVRVTGTYGKGTWLQVILKEGRKRQIREMGRLSGLPVVKIIRVRIADLNLGNLKPGHWRHLSNEETKSLKSSVIKSPVKEQRSNTKMEPVSRKKN